MDMIGGVASSFVTPDISIFEAVTLICWGMSWPVSIYKSLKTKMVHGKSPMFTMLIAVGYVSAIIHKVLFSYDYLVLLYLFNLLMILTDLYLYTRYSSRGCRRESPVKMEEIATNKIGLTPGIG